MEIIFVHRRCWYAYKKRIRMKCCDEVSKQLSQLRKYMKVFQQQLCAVGMAILFCWACNKKEDDTNNTSSYCEHDGECEQGTYCFQNRFCVSNEYGLSGKPCFEGQCHDGNHICQDDVCIEGYDHCTNDEWDGDETDRDCGGSCPGCPYGGDCHRTADCEDGFVCDPFDERCYPPHDDCENGQIDGWETDVDCGGIVCLPCSIGQICHTVYDCQKSLLCMDGVCAERPLHCGNQTQDQDETDVDCGGIDCLPCAKDAKCEDVRDCARYFVCSQGICSDPPEHCSDGDINYGEPSYDCGGSDCHPCPIDHYCYADSDCNRGLYCFDEEDEENPGHCYPVGAGRAGEPCIDMDWECESGNTCEDGICYAGSGGDCDRIRTTGSGRVFSVAIGRIDNTRYVLHGGEFAAPGLVRIDSYGNSYDDPPVSLTEIQPDANAGVGISSVAFSPYGLLAAAGMHAEPQDAEHRMQVWNAELTALSAVDQVFKVIALPDHHHLLAAYKTDTQLGLGRYTSGGDAIETLALGTSTGNELRDLDWSVSNNAAIATVITKDAQSVITGGFVEVWHSGTTTRYAEGQVGYALAETNSLVALVSRADSASTTFQLTMFDTTNGPDNWAVLETLNLSDVVGSDEEVSALVFDNDPEELFVGIRKTNLSGGGHAALLYKSETYGTVWIADIHLHPVGTLDDLRMYSDSNPYLLLSAGTDEFRVCDIDHMKYYMIGYGYACTSGSACFSGHCYQLSGYDGWMCSKPCSDTDPCEDDNLICKERADAPGLYGCAPKRLSVIQ